MLKLAKYKKSLKLSYASIAADTGLTRGYIGLLAKGVRTNPSIEVMQKISDSLCKTYDEAAKKRKLRLPRPTVEVLFFSK